MAYRDIELWRDIMEAEEADRKAYDEACERNAEETAALDEKEFWDCDQKEIDPSTMGFAEGGDDEALEERGDAEDEDGLDEEIDFSRYQLDEADMREPLTAASAALDRPASTADLAGQDSVRLATESARTANGEVYKDVRIAMYKLRAYLSRLDDDQAGDFRIWIRAWESIRGLGDVYKASDAVKQLGKNEGIRVNGFDAAKGVLDVGQDGEHPTDAAVFCRLLRDAGVEKLSDIRDIVSSSCVTEVFYGLELDKS